MKVNRVLTFFLTALFGVIFSASVFSATDPAPLTMLKNVSNKMISTLSHNQARIKRDKPFLERTVKQQLLPLFTVNTMARAVVGRTQWKSASAEQRKAFQREFTDMVVGVYAAPLADFDNDQIRFYPLSSRAAKRSRVQVKSLIIRPSGQKIPVNYRMVKIGDSWKIYDFSIEGISMIQSYRSQFESVLRQRGFSGLLRQIQQHNKRV